MTSVRRAWLFRGVSSLFVVAGLSSCFLFNVGPSTLMVAMGNDAASLCDQGLRARLTIRGRAFDAAVSHGETAPGSSVGRLLLKQPDFELNDLVLVEAWCNRSAASSGYSRTQFTLTSRRVPLLMSIVAPSSSDPPSPYTVTAPGPLIQPPTQ